MTTPYIPSIKSDTLLIPLSYIDNSTLTGQIIQGITQIILWNYAFTNIKSYCKHNFSSTSWYKQAIHKGEDELLMLLCAVPQHTLSAIFIYLGLYFNCTQLFCIGTLGEFAFEFIELYNMIMSKWYYNNSSLADEMLWSLIFHHLPGVLIIIPTNLYFGSNILIQKITFSLLVIAPVGCFFFILFKTRNVRDLQERGQFTVYLFICISILIYFRFYLTPSYIIQFLYNDFMDLYLLYKIMFVFYGILINLFNITFIMILSQRLYKFLYCGKCTEIKMDLPMIARRRSAPIFSNSYSKKMN